MCPVADKDLVEDTWCENPTEDCNLANQRFLERCVKYKSCPEPGEEPVFVCQQNQCVSRRETLNCKLEKQCTELESQFLCNNGLCQNISRIMECKYYEVGATYDCTDKRNCIMLTGLFQCRQGHCTEVNTRSTRVRLDFVTILNRILKLICSDFFGGIAE